MLRLLLTLLLLFCLLPVPAQTYGSLFASEEVLQLTLTANLTTFLKDRGNNPQYHDAALSYKDASGAEQRFAVRIRVRGHYRRDPFICDFPPFRINFPGKGKTPAPFEGQDKLKVVAHCQDEQYIFREYYLYKIYNLLTDKSFRVRLVQIRYVDSSGGRPEETHYGFIIESEEEMAARNGASPLPEDISLKPADVDREALTLAYVFNFMIANRDFDINVRQNLKVITNGSGLPVPVPYDFDWSGMVDASYTKTTLSKGSTYEDRQKLKALCRELPEYEAALDRLRAVREQIVQIYEASPYLSAESKAEALKNFKGFFARINKAKYIRETFISDCE